MSAPKNININKQCLDATTPLNVVDSMSLYLVVKHWFDIGLIVLFSPIILPLMLVTASIIKLQSKGPVFFWQKRVGYQGKEFYMIKFRSMEIDSEKGGSQFAQSDDSRVTRFGGFIRKMRIDELPQLWNVFRGDMSLIGPRPEQVKFVKEYKMRIPNYMDRHSVLPGITGLAQVKQGYVDDFEGTCIKLKYDLFYVDNLSFKLDLRIVFLTFYTMMTGFGAR